MMCLSLPRLLDLVNHCLFLHVVKFRVECCTAKAHSCLAQEVKLTLGMKTKKHQGMYVRPLYMLKLNQSRRLELTFSKYVVKKRREKGELYGVFLIHLGAQWGYLIWYDDGACFGNVC